MQQLQVAFSMHVSVVNSTFIVLYYIVLHSSSLRSATAVSKEVTISLVHLYSTKYKNFRSMLTLDKCIKCNAILNGLK